jgi:hypothetical protein
VSAGAGRDLRFSGKIAVFAMAAMLAAVLLAYRYTLPEPWLRAFAEDIAIRAESDPNPPPPEDTRQAQRREPVDNRLICLARTARQPWDRVVIVTGAAGLGAIAELTPEQRRESEVLLQSDRRYQLIVLVREGAVVDRQLFFTFWGDLSALDRPTGFAPGEAIFTAASRGGRYILAPAAGASLSDCPTE